MDDREEHGGDDEGFQEDMREEPLDFSDEEDHFEEPQAAEELTVARS